MYSVQTGRKKHTYERMAQAQVDCTVWVWGDNGVMSRGAGRGFPQWLHVTEGELEERKGVLASVCVPSPPERTSGKEITLENELD